jgi:tRNA(Ile)-lysidine synthase
MNYTARTREIFEAAFKSLENFHPMLNKRPALLAYSGGKDSTLVLHFYHYLFLQGFVPSPMIFHLEHCIRNNSEQEKSIRSYISNSFPFKTYFKKKMFRSRVFF